MRPPLAPALCLALALLGAGALQAARVEVTLIAGQSNATGQGYVNNLPANFSIPADVELFHSGPPHLKPATPARTWAPLAPASESPDRFGLELSLGRRLRELRPQARLAFIKHARSGTNLHTQWHPGAGATDRGDWGPHFTTFVETVEAGLQALRDRGDEPVLCGLVWYQGEADANGGRNAPADTTHARNYAVNFTHFIARVRAQFAAPNLPVVYAVITPSPERGPGRELVRQAQRDVAADSGSPLAVPGTWCVATDDLPRRKDDPDTPYPNDTEHVGTAGLLTLGTHFADLLSAAAR